MTTIGFVGLGSMGAPLAGRLLPGNVLFSTVTDDAALAAVSAGPDGILAGLRPGTVHVEMSTVSPQASRALAERGGIDPELAARAMAGSSIGSPMLRARLPLVLDLPERAWFDMRLMHKDIRLALQAAGRTHLALPTATAVDRELSLAEQLGYEHRDIAGLYQVLARTARTTTAAGSDGARPAA